MRVDHRQIVRCDIKVEISDSQEHSTVGGRITLKGTCVGLERIRGVVINIIQRRVCSVELIHPHGEMGRASGGIGNVAVVGTNRLAGAVPGEEDLATRVTQRVGTVVRDGWVAVLSKGCVDARLLVGDVGRAQCVRIATSGLVVGIRAIDTSRVRLVENVERREVLPNKTSLVHRA